MTGLARRRRLRAVLLCLALPVCRANAQEVPPEGIEQLQHLVGDRVEALTILGGDQGASRGFYSFRGGSVADLDITKLGGGGDIAEPRPLGNGPVRWAPVLDGNLGWISAENDFQTGYLKGNGVRFDTFAAQLGVGARFFLADHVSLSPVIAGIYGHTENDFNARNAVGEIFEMLASGRYVNWETDTWSVVPSAEFRYEWTRGRTAFEFVSKFTFFHTESFNSSSEFVRVEGDSSTWENRVGVEAPLGIHVFGREVESGGFVSRTEFSGGAAEGFDASYGYTGNARLVLDFAGHLWKTRWLGLGASYFRGPRLRGWSAGLDFRFVL